MRVFRLIFLALLLLAIPASLLIAAGWWWLNSYVKTDAFRQAMETSLSQTMQAPMKIQRVTFDFINGVELHEVTYHSTHFFAEQNADVVINRVDCAYSWLNLLQGKLTLTQLTLQAPQIVLHSVNPTLTSAPEPSNSLAPPVNPEDFPQAEPTPVKTLSDQDPSALPLHFTLNEFQLRDGNLNYQNENNEALVSLHKIQVQADTKKINEDLIDGRLLLGEITYGVGWKILNFSTSFSYQHGALQAPSFTADAFGGNLSGDYTLSPPLPSTLNFNVKGSDLGRIKNILAPQLPVTGTLDLQSQWHALETARLEGEGDLQIENGQFSGIPILQEISNALKIKELAAPTFTEAASHFNLTGQQLRLTSLDVEGDLFSLTGDGTVNVSEDKTIAFNLVLMLRKEAMDQLPRLAAASFIKKEDGTGSIAFQVTGTLPQPSTDLPNRLFNQNSEFQNLLSKTLENFFHKQKKNQVQPLTSPAPPASVPFLTNSFPASVLPEVTNAPALSLPPSPATNPASSDPGSGTAH